MAMGIWLPGGGGGASSDDCTLMRAAVPSGMKAVTADSDDEAMEGTLNPDTTLADSQALSGQTFLKWNPQTKLFEKHTGNMANKGAWNGSVAMNGTVTIPAGYHNGSGKVTGPAITNRGNYGGTGNSRGNDTSGQRMWVKVPGGYYNENAQVFLNWADIRSMAGITPDKIKKNVSIMGITGTHEGYVSSPFYLYNKGVWNGLQTTGFTVTRSTGNGFEANDGSYLIFTMFRKNSNGGAARTNSMFNVSAYKYMKVSIKSLATDEYTKFYVGLSKSNNTYPESGLTAKYYVSHDGICILDISSLNDSYFIWVMAVCPQYGNTTGGVQLQIDQIFFTNN